ncbi:porin [Phenylobacterium sp.]|uniref:OprO/OprP family phosphate-selective porin n=1 Tax=Phenylobacterium sp. TaxID=1871053 RepID=UPI00286CB8AC|nr:porin [Phenylobacterium sp.]
MAWKTKLIVGVSALALAWPAMAAADEATDARIKALEEQLSLLQGQIADLKQSTSNNIAAVRKDAAVTTVSLANGRPSISSADGRFTASFRGVFQLDAAQYDQSGAGPLASDFRRGSLGDAVENDRARDLNDGANFRRARIGIEGKAFGDFEYNFLYDFGGSGNEEAGKISAAWVQYNGLPVANAKIRIGAFSPMSGMEADGSTNGSLFAERAAPSELVRGLGAGDGRTAAALTFGGERWTASAAVSGNIIGVQTYDEQTSFVGRLAVTPHRGEHSLIHLGLNTTVVLDPAATGPRVNGVVNTPIRLRERPELRVDGTRLVDTGSLDADGLTAVGGEFAAQWRNLSLQAEYFDIGVDRKGAFGDAEFSGWYAQAAWTITGEPRRYAKDAAAFDSPRPAKPFDLKTGDWGAWELGLRYSTLDLNHLAGNIGTAPIAGAVRGGEQEIFTLGLNWYLNNGLRFQAAYQDVSVDRLSPGGTAFVAGSTPPAGAQVGQDLKIYSLRTQYAF